MMEDISDSRADEVLAAEGESCATLTPLIKAKMRQMTSGRVLEVKTDDRSALDGIPAWSRLTGEELLATVEEDGKPLKFYLRKK
jgi:TusA-related sulfurtransferase